MFGSVCLVVEAHSLVSRRDIEGEVGLTQVPKGRRPERLLETAKGLSPCIYHEPADERTIGVQFYDQHHKTW